MALEWNERREANHLLKPIIDLLVPHKQSRVCTRATYKIPRLQNNLKDWNIFKESLALGSIPKDASGRPKFGLLVPYHAGPLS